MKSLFFSCLTVLCFGCNTADKKDKEQASSPGQDSSSMTDPMAQKSTGDIAIKTVVLTAAEIPPALKFKGKMKQAWQWTDKLGDNVFITAVVAPFDVKDEEGNDAQTAEVHAYHYVKKEGDYQLIWQLKDAVKECSLDMFCDFLNNSATVTDLDNNGVAETKIQYAVSCHGDVLPSYMKLILYENTVKYTLQGNRWIKDVPETEFDVNAANVNLEKLPGYNKEKDEGSTRTFGRYETERDFADAPAAFLEYARNEWLKFAKEEE